MIHLSLFSCLIIIIATLAGSYVLVREEWTVTAVLLTSELC